MITTRPASTRVHFDGFERRREVFAPIPLLCDLGFRGLQRCHLALSRFSCHEVAYVVSLISRQDRRDHEGRGGWLSLVSSW
jgi:hypothetical protein